MGTIVVVVVVGQTFRPISSKKKLLAKQLIASQNNQLLANYFFIHSQHSEKDGKQERIK